MTPASPHPTRWPLVLVLPVLLAGLAGCGADAGPSEEKQLVAKAAALQPADRERIPAPELDGGLDWLNAAGPIRMKDLKGKIVILDPVTEARSEPVRIDSAENGAFEGSRLQE